MLPRRPLLLTARMPLTWYFRRSPAAAAAV